MKLLTSKQLKSISEIESWYEREFDNTIEFDYKKGYYWCISQGDICMTPKDFYDKENSLSDFDYFALNFMSDEDINDCGLVSECSSTYTFRCTEDRLREILDKYKTFFEENIYMCD